MKITPLPLTLGSLQDTNFCGSVTESVTVFLCDCPSLPCMSSVLFFFQMTAGSDTCCGTNSWKSQSQPGGQHMVTNMWCLMWERQATCCTDELSLKTATY